MPRRPKVQPPSAPPTALVASAHRYSGKAPRIYSPSKDWQVRAYHHYSLCGEARFGARYFGHAMSRATLHLEDSEGKHITTGASAENLAALFGNADGQSGMLEMVGVHLTVGGECYLIGRDMDGADVWEVVSALEVESDATGWRVMSSEANIWVPLNDNDTVIRVWVPKPDRRWEADSPFRSMLPVLDEIEWLTRYIHAQTASRLTGNGILFLPDNMTFPPPPPKDGKEQEYANEAEGFMLSLGETAMESLKGNGSPSEMIPIIVTADSEALDKVKHLTFWTPLDQQAREMRRDAIHRFALGMDMPPEMILGMSSNGGTGGGRSNGVSHWGAWMLEEQTIKLHLEPMLDVLCAAITSSYIRPLDEGSTDVVKADTTALRLRPDRSQEAMELYDRGLIKSETVVRENGFTEDDAHDDASRKEWLLMKVASGSSTPEQVDAALKELGVDLGIPQEDLVGQVPRESPSDPSLDQHPDRPKTPEYAIYNVLTLRALERAGNRLRNIHQVKTPGKAYDAHVHLAANGSTNKALEDAWDMAEMVLADNPQAAKIIASLDAYCRTLLVNRDQHSFESLASWCEAEGI